MKKNYLSFVKSLAAITLVSFLMEGQTVSAQRVDVGLEKDYTVPSWTKLKAALSQLTPSTQPYSINMTLNGDPKTQIGFSWYTNTTDVKGKVQLIAKVSAMEADFTGSTTLNLEANIQNVTTNYVSSNNKEVTAATGIKVGETRSYTSHKVLASGLLPNTTYSYRLGNENAWSEIGTFTTAKTTKDAFSFIYITDTQANTADMFDISQKTVHAAKKLVPDARFVLCNGDFVESSGSSNSEWEWEQWFGTMQDIWMKYPIVAIQGNHDTSANNNFSKHFNTDNTYNQRTTGAKTAMDGTVYSFVYGDALFMSINYEDWKATDYFASLKAWMREQVAAHPEVKWRIATYHKNMFTGSGSHQSDADAKAVRAAMLPVFDELKIDLALQGHDHVYEVIGPVKNTTQTLLTDAVEHIEIVGESGARENMTGKQGGVFNVNEGTLYFLNNSAGKKKYEPRDEAAMVKAYPNHGVENYWGLFSGKFGQTGEATFSKITLSTDTIAISTYTVDGNGKETLFDSFKVIKENKTSAVKSEKLTQVKIYSSSADQKVIVEGMIPEKVEIFSSNGQLVLTAQTNEVNISSLTPGMYLVKAGARKDVYYSKVMIEK
ncbi:MAG: fibronectin type III domain-containing protein [Bacteroides sp.]